jgi:hypothetical protein
LDDQNSEPYHVCGERPSTNCKNCKTCIVQTSVKSNNVFKKIIIKVALFGLIKKAFYARGIWSLAWLMPKSNGMQGMDT